MQCSNRPDLILVNNAGLHADAVFPGMSPEKWQQVMDVNLNGFYNVTQLTMPMIRGRWGRIVTITSVAGLVGNRGRSTTPRPRAPSTPPPSPSPSSWPAAASPSMRWPRDHRHRDDRGQLRPGRHRAPGSHEAGRQARRVADLVAFLVSDQATYITGQIISVNGGMV
jgi:3-oxoacyl-[acyl-carrier protein] reductase